MNNVVDEKKKMIAVTTMRSFIDMDAKPPKVSQRSEPLFSDKEIMDELYTPLVRELVLAETFVPPKFSATQKMIDGSNDYYIKECKEKGKSTSMGVADFAK